MPVTWNVCTNSDVSLLIQEINACNVGTSNVVYVIRSSLQYF